MSIGQPLSRIEGSDKVTGRARYAADVALPGMLYAVIVGAPVAAGRVLRIHRDAALAQSGVVRVLTREDMPKFGKIRPPAAVLNLPLQTDEILYEGEPVALVLGETIEAAEHGASLIRVEVQRSEPLVAGKGKIDQPEFLFPLGEDLTKGDVPAGLAAGAVRVRQTYDQPARHHNPMETSATLADWQGDRLTMYDAVQAGYNVPPVVGAALGVPPANIRVISPHTGGGFGCKGYVWPHQILAAAAARVVSRPVRLAHTRSTIIAIPCPPPIHAVAKP